MRFVNKWLKAFDEARGIDTQSKKYGQPSKKLKSSNPKVKADGHKIGMGIKAYFNPEGKKDNKKEPGDASDSDTDEEFDSSDESAEDDSMSGDDISNDEFQNNVDFSPDKK